MDVKELDIMYGDVVQMRRYVKARLAESRAQNESFKLFWSKVAEHIINA